MRRFLVISFTLLALAVSAAGATPAAHAQTTGGAPLTTQGGGTEVGGLGGAIDDAAKLAAANTKAEEDRAGVLRTMLNSVMWAIASLFAWLVGVAALTLNYAMYYTVVDMGRYINGLSSIGTVWKILRDIGNILLIFGFLAVGISIIIDSAWYGGGQKLLPTLLIAAVFTNFSLFAAEAVIDVNNLFATQFYKQINGGDEIPIPTDTKFSDIINKKGVAGVLMSRLGLPSIYGEAKEAGADGKTLFAGDTPWYMGFMSIILFIVVAFVMFALAFILVARFVILIYLIILSPIGVAGLAVPHLAGYARAWWSNLFRQAITAPILLLLLYIALMIITDGSFFGFGTSKPVWGGVETGDFIGFAATLLSYFIAVGLLLAIVIITKSLSAFGASWATKTAGKLSFGATAFAGRRTVGRLSNYTARKIRSSSLGRSETGRLLAGVADRGAKASFDVRGTSALKNIPGGGISAGEAQKGGYRGTEDKAIKAREDYAKSLNGRKQTPSEQRQIDMAKGNRIYAEGLHEKASDEHKLTETETIKLRAEVKRLENLSIKSPETDRALGAAQQKLATSETSLAAAITKLDEAAERLTDTQEAEKKIKEAINANTSAKSAQQAYGESLQKKTFLGVPRAPYDWTTVAGSARREAAEKIKTEKPDKDKLADLVKKMQKEADEAEGEKEGKTEEEPKPETPKS